MSVLAIGERYYAVVFTVCVLFLVVLGVIVLLRQRPKLGHARIVVPLCAGGAAVLAAFDEIVFRGGISGAPRAAAFASIAGIAWGVVLTGIVGTVRYLASRRTNRAAQR
jgi:hypothetical protein